MTTEHDLPPLPPAKENTMDEAWIKEAMRLADRYASGLFLTDNQNDARRDALESRLRSLAASATQVPQGDAEALARRFHNLYEHLAPQYGYETRPETRAFDPQSANGKLMIAVCAELSQQAVPGGWKTVPIKPAKEQLDAARDWSNRQYGKPIGNDAATGCYDAMVAASPPTPQAATQGEAVAFDASKLKRYDYGYRSDEWGMGRALQTYPKADGPFVLYEDVVALAVINEPAPAPSKEQTNG